MADTNNLRDKVISTIYPNGKGAINAADHQALLLDMVTEMAKTNLDVFSLQKNKADKAAIPTKLSQLEQDIQVYDDTEIRERIEENEVLIEDLQNTKINKEADDYYPQLSVGLADNLSGVDVVDSEVNFRRSGGGAISDGVARIEAIKGNSVVWNQVYPTGWSVTREGITTTSQNNIITANGTLTATYFDHERFVENEVNHKYLFIVEGLSSAFNGANFSLQNRQGNEATISNGFAYFFHDNSDPSLGRNIGFSRLTSGAVISETYILRQIDLTKMFGAGYEPTTIEEFYSRIPMGVDLNAYNEGEVIHMDVQSIESQGVNAWDEEWRNGHYSSATGGYNKSSQSVCNINPIKVLPNQKYYSGRATSGAIDAYAFFYDADMNFISYVGMNSGNFTSPANAVYMNFYFSQSSYGTTYNHDICINISDASINGKYFPYIKRTEDLSIIRKYFPQGMKLAGSAHDEIRYNKASGKWEYTKSKTGGGRIKGVDMGELNFVYNAPSEGKPHGYLSANLIGRAFGKYNLLCDKYTYANANLSQDKSIYGLDASSAVIIVDSAYTDAASFKAAMQGVILYYESNDWEWEELDAEDQFKDLDYQVWNCGTEKAIAEGKSAPLAADITYGFNAIGKIKELESLVAELRAKVGI